MREIQVTTYLKISSIKIVRTWSRWGVKKPIKNPIHIQFTVVKSFIKGFLRRPQKCGSIFLIVLTLLGNVKTKGKVEPNFYGLLRIHELYKDVAQPIQKKYVSSMNMNASPPDQ